MKRCQKKKGNWRVENRDGKGKWEGGGKGVGNMEKVGWKEGGQQR